MTQETNPNTPNNVQELNLLIHKKVEKITSGGDFTQFNDRISELVANTTADDLFQTNAHNILPPLALAISLKDHKTAAEIIDKEGVNGEHFLKKFQTQNGDMNCIDLAISMNNTNMANDMISRLTPEQSKPYQLPALTEEQSIGNFVLKRNPTQNKPPERQTLLLVTSAKTH